MTRDLTPLHEYMKTANGDHPDCRMLTHRKTPHGELGVFDYPGLAYYLIVRLNDGRLFIQMYNYRTPAEIIKADTEILAAFAGAERA